MDHPFLRARFLPAHRHRSISLLRKKSKSGLSRFLFTRGLWLIFLEMVVVRCLGWQFNFDYHVVILNVLWALGWAMIVLSILVYLPASAVAVFGALLITAHNLFDSIDSSNWLWTILHSPNFLLNRPGHTVFVAYPLVPWVGVTAVGYAFGQIYRWPSARRKAFLLQVGLGMSDQQTGPRMKTLLPFPSAGE